MTPDGPVPSVFGMTNPHSSVPSYPPPGPTPGPTREERSAGLRPGLILGLALLPLVIGVARASGAIQTGGNAIVLVGLVTAVWLTVVAGRNVARPLATLTLTGLTAGVYLALLFGGVSVLGIGAPFPVAGIIALPIVQTVWGFIAGLLALLINWVRT